MLSELITQTTLEEQAGAAAFSRGAAYFSDGAVERLRISEDKINARVQGTEAYLVELREDNGVLACDCSCPRAADGYFCKHCVALGLAWLAEHASARRQDPWRDIKAYLLTQTPEILSELLLKVALRDDLLYQSLLLRAERSRGDLDAADGFMRAINDVTRTHGFIDWNEAGRFAANIEQVVDSLAELLRPDTAALLVELAEHAIECVETALEQVDDSGGQVGEIAYRLGDLHLKACLMSRPDAEALAERLFMLETTLPFGIYSFDPNTYRDVLGEAGLCRYRTLAETEWRNLKPIDAKNSYDAHRSKITCIMEQLAETCGNIEELIAIKSCDLSTSSRYLDIAEILARTGQPDSALAWAERGLKAFAERPDNRLRDFLVALYLVRARNNEALQLTWIQFEELPTLDNYKKLHDVADRLGIWPEQRARAQTLLTRVIDATTTTRWKPNPAPANYSLLVAIALWENNLDDAQGFADKGFCQPDQLLKLAERLASSKPEDALSLYQRAIPLIVERTNNGAYAEAIQLIRKMRLLMNAPRFSHYLGALRTQFKPKRNFIKLLDELAQNPLK